MKTILKDKTSLHYISSEVYVSDSEMNSIVNDKELTEALYKGMEDGLEIPKSTSYAEYVAVN